MNTFVALSKFEPFTVSVNPPPYSGATVCDKSVMAGALHAQTEKPLVAAETPASVVTVKVRAPAVAPAAIVMDTGSMLSVPPLPIDAVTPDPLKVTAVAALKKLPLMVADIVVPSAPLEGVIPVGIGNVVAYTSTGTDAVVPPPGNGFVTLIGYVLGRIRAAEGMTAVNCVELTKVAWNPMYEPPDVIACTPEFTVKFVPVKVNVVSGEPTGIAVGVTDVNVGTELSASPTRRLTGTTMGLFIACGELIVMLPAYTPTASGAALAKTLTVPLPVPLVALKLSQFPPEGVLTVVEAVHVNVPLPSRLIPSGT